MLGRGAFKTVYKAFDEQEGIEVAWNQVGCPPASQTLLAVGEPCLTASTGSAVTEGPAASAMQVRVSELVSSKEERDRLFAEIRVLKQLKHKNIMTFYDSWLDPKTYTVNFITELFTSGTLRQ